MWTFFVDQSVNVPETTCVVSFAIDSDDEGCEAVKFSDVLSRSVAARELIPSSPLCEDCAFYRVDSDVDSLLWCFCCVCCVQPCVGFL